MVCCVARKTLAQLVHLTKGASTQPRVPYCSPIQNGLATLLVLLLITVRCPLFHDLLSVTRPTPHKTVLGNLITWWHLANRSATPGKVTQHLALLLFDALLTISSHLPGPVLPIMSSGATLHICHQASRT